MLDSGRNFSEQKCNATLALQRQERPKQSQCLCLLQRITTISAAMINATAAAIPAFFTVHLVNYSICNNLLRRHYTTTYEGCQPDRAFL